MESLGLSQKDVQFMNKWRRIKEATGSPGKMAIKTQCVCVYYLNPALWLLYSNKRFVVNDRGHVTITFFAHSHCIEIA